MTILLTILVTILSPAEISAGGPTGHGGGYVQPMDGSGGPVTKCPATQSDCTPGN